MEDDIFVPSGGVFVTCSHKECGYRFSALLEKRSDECFCPKCKNKVNLSTFTIRLLKENGQFHGQVMEDGTQKEETNGTGQVIEFDTNGILTVVKVEDKKPFNQMVKNPYNED